MNGTIQLQENRSIYINNKLYKLHKNFNFTSYDSRGIQKDIGKNDYQTVLERGYICFIPND